MSVKSRYSKYQCQNPKTVGDYCFKHGTGEIIRFTSIIEKRLKKEEKRREENKLIVKNQQLQQQQQLKPMSHLYDDSATKIQSVFRRWNIHRRLLPNNREDCGTLECILEIPIEFYIQYQDTADNLWYAFDIRTLNLIMKTKNPINPYNTKDLTVNKKFIDKYNDKKQYILCKNKNICHDVPKLTELQRHEQRVLKIFQTFDENGYYTDTTWFSNLSFEQLRQFYRSSNDMFTFRIKEYGLFFCNFMPNLEKINKKHIKILQNEILKEIEEIINTNEKDHKITGIILILTVLVEISHPASLAFPHLLQDSFFPVNVD
jgi:hypothetical protein